MSANKRHYWLDKIQLIPRQITYILVLSASDGRKSGQRVPVFPSYSFFLDAISVQV